MQDNNRSVIRLAFFYFCIFANFLFISFKDYIEHHHQHHNNQPLKSSPDSLQLEHLEGEVNTLNFRYAFKN